VRTAVKHIVVMRFNVVQDRPIEFAGSRDREASIAIQQSDARPGLGIKPAIAIEGQTETVLEP
jgi:hypothetical protein